MAVRGGLDYLIKVTDQFTPTLSSFIRQVKAGQVEMRRLKNDIGKGLKVRGGGGFKRFKQDIKEANRAVKDLIRTMRHLKGAGSKKIVNSAQTVRLRAQNAALRQQLALLKKNRRAQQNLNMEQKKSGRLLSRLLKIYAAMFIAATAISAAARAAFKVGEISSQMERAEASLAGVLTATFDITNAQGKTLEGAEALSAAYAESKRQIMLLRAEAKGIASASELAVSLTAVTAGSSGQLQGEGARRATLTLLRTLKSLPDIPNSAEEIRNVIQGKARAGQTQLAAVAGGAPALNKAIQQAIADGNLGEKIEEIFGPIADSLELLEGKLPLLVERMKAAFEDLMLGEGSAVVSALRRTAAALILFMESSDGEAQMGVLFRLLSGLIDVLTFLGQGVLGSLLIILNTLEGVVNAGITVMLSVMTGLMQAVQFLANALSDFFEEDRVDIGAAGMEAMANAMAAKTARSFAAAAGKSLEDPEGGPGAAKIALKAKQKADDIQAARVLKIKLDLEAAILRLKTSQADVQTLTLAGTLSEVNKDALRLIVQEDKWRVALLTLMARREEGKITDEQYKKEKALLEIVTLNAKTVEDRAANAANRDKEIADLRSIMQLRIENQTLLAEENQRDNPLAAAATAFGETAPTEFEFALSTMKSAVQGFASTTSALFADLFNLKSAEDALTAFAEFFKKFASQLIQQLIAIGIAKAFAKIASSGSGGGTNPGGSFAGLGPTSLFGGTGSAFNKGGLVQGFADGGQVTEFKRPSGISPKDTVPAWLTPNEWVVKAESARAYGHDVMDAINRGLIDPLALRALAGAGSLRGMGRGKPSWGYAAGGRVSDRASTHSAQPTVSASRSFVVSDEQTFDRMLAGGSDAFMRFLSRNRGSVNTSLKSVRGA